MNSTCNYLFIRPLAILQYFSIIVSFVKWKFRVNLQKSQNVHRKNWFFAQSIERNSTWINIYFIILTSSLLHASPRSSTVKKCNKYPPICLPIVPKRVDNAKQYRDLCKCEFLHSLTRWWITPLQYVVLGETRLQKSYMYPQTCVSLHECAEIESDRNIQQRNCDIHMFRV